jgi:hypothetical protein
MDPYETAELRRQQAAFGKATRDIDIQNSWFAAPALAPEMVVGALELAAAGAALAGRQVARPILNFLEREPPRIIRGDNVYARAGMRAHADLNARVAQKPAWKPQPTVSNEKGVFRPDVGLRVRDPVKSNSRFQLELKPDTPSGRRAAARAVKRYVEGTGNKTRAIFYNPKDYM